MNKFDYHNITPFKWFILENFPFIEADFDALTNWQLFCKLGKEINKVINNVNTLGEQVENVTDAFINLENYINNYFNNLDIQEEINNKLDEMAESGELGEIISQYIPENVLSKTDAQYKKLNLQRLFRKISRKGINNINDDEDEDYYSQLEGFERIDANTIVTCQLSNKNISNNMVLVQVINISTGVVLREAELPLGHANSITYNPDNGRLYIAECFRYESGVRVDSHRIYQLNYGTLSLENTIEYDYVLLGVAYDRVKHKLYGRVAQTIYEIDINTFNTLSTITLNNTANYATGQSFAVNNDLIATIDSNPEIINLYDIEGNYINCYSMPNYIENSFGYGESEDLTLDGLNFYVGSYISGSQNGEISWYNISYGNFVKNIPIANYTNNAASFKQNRYVDNTTNKINPNGTESNPFNEIAELEDFSHSPNAQKFSFICNLKNSETPYYYCFLNNSRINVIIATPNARESIVGGLRIDNTNVNLLNLKIQNNNTFNTHHITASGLSTVTIDSCTFEEEQENTYCCEFYESSKCNLKGTITVPTNEAVVKLSDGAELETYKVKYDNIVVTSSNVKAKVYALKDGSYKGLNETLYPNQCLQNNNINFEDYRNLFKYVNVVARQTDGKQLFKFETGNRNMSIILGNMYNDATSTDIIFSEYNLQLLSDGYFNLSSWKAINVKTDSIETLGSNAQIYDIYFSND